jgi:hypothetical protein
MNILKLALLGSLRIVFLGSLKVALFVYALLLSDTAFAGGVPKVMAMLAILLPTPRSRQQQCQHRASGSYFYQPPARTCGRKVGMTPILEILFVCLVVDTGESGEGIIIPRRGLRGSRRPMRRLCA